MIQISICCLSKRFFILEYCELTVICITPHPLGIFCFPFHGLYLPHLGIIDHVPLKINCSHLKTQFFIIFDLFVIFYKAICISYAGRACLIMSSLSFLLVHPAKRARHESLCDLKKTFTA